MRFQNLKSALRLAQIATQQQQHAPMLRGDRCASVECSVRARGVGVIVNRRMTCFARLTGSVFKALISISAAWVQHGEPGKRREVHKSRSLGCGNGTRRLRRKIPLLFGEDSLKTVCFDSFLLKRGGCFGTLNATVTDGHNQHRASRTPQNAVGDAAEEKMRKRAAPM